jgi:ribosome maturation factor RimP
MIIEKELEQAIEQKIEELGYSMVKLSFYKGKSRNKVDIVIYSPKGIKHSDCRKVTKSILDDLELEAKLGEDYFFEVSSPGINRKLSTLKEFKIFADKIVEFSIKGESLPKIGTLKGIDGELVLLEMLKTSEKQQINYKEFEYAKLSDLNGGK